MLQVFFSQTVFALENANLKIKTIDEKTFDIAEFRGKKNVLVVFWAEWCVDCIREIPAIEKLHKNCSKKLEIIGVTTDRKNAREKVLNRIKNTTYQNAFIGDASENNFPEINAVPTLYLIGKDGAATEIETLPTCTLLK